MYIENQGNEYQGNGYNNCNCGNVQANNLVLGPVLTPCPISTATNVTVRIPVLIATARVEADVEACIDFPCNEDFYEIKRIKKNVFITQGRIIPLPDPVTQTERVLNGKLYLKGFVEKNIEYATADCVSRDKDVINGKIKHHTVRVPFQVVTPVTISNLVLNNRGPLSERTIYCDTSKEGCCFDCNEGVKGRSFCESDFNETVNFYQRPFVVLDSFTIYELDFNKDPEPLHKRCPGTDVDGYRDGDNDKDCENKNKAVVYDKIQEKFALFLCIRVLQDQYVRVCPPAGGGTC